MIRRPPRSTLDRSSAASDVYKRQGQYYAYYPDSTSSSIDKKNVRDGHYTVWSPTIWMLSLIHISEPTRPY